jgi:hypothetical protein
LKLDPSCFFAFTIKSKLVLVSWTTQAAQQTSVSELMVTFSAVNLKRLKTWSMQWISKGYKSRVLLVQSHQHFVSWSSSTSTTSKDETRALLNHTSNRSFKV